MINPPPSVNAISNDGILSPAWKNWLSQIYDICFAVRQSGTTAQRPVKSLWIGRPYFDTTLGYAIHYDGTNWVDSAGSTV